MKVRHDSHLLQLQGMEKSSWKADASYCQRKKNHHYYLPVNSASSITSPATHAHWYNISRNFTEASYHIFKNWIRIPSHKINLMLGTINWTQNWARPSWNLGGNQYYYSAKWTQQFAALSVLIFISISISIDLYLQIYIYRWVPSFRPHQRSFFLQMRINWPVCREPKSTECSALTGIFMSQPLTSSFGDYCRREDKKVVADGEQTLAAKYLLSVTMPLYIRTQCCWDFIHKTHTMSKVIPARLTAWIRSLTRTRRVSSDLMVQGRNGQFYSGIQTLKGNTQVDNPMCLYTQEVLKWTQWV